MASRFARLKVDWRRRSKRWLCFKEQGITPKLYLLAVVSNAAAQSSFASRPTQVTKQGAVLGTMSGIFHSAATRFGAANFCAVYSLGGQGLATVEWQWQQGVPGHGATDADLCLVH